METKVVFRIPEENLARLSDRIVVLNRKAKKLGCPEIVSHIVSVEVVEKNRNGYVWDERFYHVHIEGVHPKLDGGWTFVGTLEHTELGNIMRSLPSEAIPESYRNVKAQCDHCKKTRSRKDTYIVKNEAGEFKQVGHSCIRDFLGGRSPEQIGFMSELLREMRELGLNDGSFVKPMTTPLILMEMTEEVIKRDGWVSKSASKAYSEASSGAGITATSVKAFNYCFPTRIMIERGDVLRPTQETKAFAKDALEWILSLEPKSDYEHNLKIACGLDFIDSKNSGIVASAVAAYRKHLEIEDQKRLERQKKLSLAEISKYFGTVGERTVVTLKLDGEHVFDGGQYGELFLYRFSTADGSVAVWWTKKQSLEVGKTYTLKVTIKEHTEYKGIKQTVLSRCKVEVKDEANETFISRDR